MTVQELYDEIGDYGNAKTCLMNDRLITKFVLKFTEDDSFEKLMKAWEEKNEEEIFRAAHTMKGVCANLALSHILVPVKKITEEYRTGNQDRQEPAEIADWFEQLQIEYNKTVSAIKKFEMEQV